MYRKEIHMKVYRVVIEKPNGEKFSRLINTTDQVIALKEMDKWQNLLVEMGSDMNCILEIENDFNVTKLQTERMVDNIINKMRLEKFKSITKNDVLNAVTQLDNIINGYNPDGKGCIEDYNELFNNPKHIDMLNNISNILEILMEYKKLESDLSFDKTI
jgi:hypothetical protein